jgi:glycosyltransferase involved in cell wall biosynthesis
LETLREAAKKLGFECLCVGEWQGYWTEGYGHRRTAILKGRKMRIGIDAYPLVHLGGISRYVTSLLKEIILIDTKNEYFLYLPSKAQCPVKGKNINLRFTGSFFGKSATLWMQQQAKKALLKDKIDIFWGAQGILPLNLPSSIKTVLTVYDLTWKLYPQVLNWDNTIIFNLFFAKSLTCAGQVTAISENTKQDLERFFPSVGNKITVVYCGVENNSFTPKTPSDVISQTLAKRLNIKGDYILTVSTLEPRKNIAGILKAYHQLQNMAGNKIQLLIAGRPGWKTRNIYKTYRSLGLSCTDVIFTGYVQEAELIELYRYAKLFLSVPLYEGFGLPAIEAMSCGVPVVASSIPIFKEVLDDAAVLVSPEDPKEIAAAMHQVLSNNKVSMLLTDRGIKRAGLFSWRSAALQLLEIFNN